MLLDPEQAEDVSVKHPELVDKMLRWMSEAPPPSDVWPSPGETEDELQRRLKRNGVTVRQKNVDG